MRQAEVGVRLDRDWLAREGQIELDQSERTSAQGGDVRAEGEVETLNGLSVKLRSATFSIDLTAASNFGPVPTTCG